MNNIFFLMFLFIFSCSHRGQKSPLIIPDSLTEAVMSSSRTEENVVRDTHVHAGDTLDFFGITPKMTVAEISPRAGYWTEILAPYLAQEGQYVMVVPRMSSRPPKFMIENERKLQDILLHQKAAGINSKFVPFEPLSERNKIKPEYVDLVIAITGVHNWVAKNETEMAFKFIYAILRPGGTLGIVQHRIAEGKKNIPMSGYMTEKQLITYAKRAGFRLVAKSEINANPKDTADYPKGVWTLPPTYRLGATDREKYEEIGESDRMTLKFLRP